MKTIKIDDWNEVPNNFTGIAKHVRGDKYWYLNGKFHREGDPAVECVNGDKHWYLNGKHHREDGPAIVCVNGYKSWWLNDNRHRIDGPAIEWIDGIKEYWINDKRVTKEAQEVLYAMYKLKGLL